MEENMMPLTGDKSLFVPVDDRICMKEQADSPFYMPDCFAPLWKEEPIEEGMFYVDLEVCPALKLFLEIVAGAYNEYDDFSIPIKKWKKMLTIWQKYIDAASYDSFVEETAGVDYQNWCVKNPEAMRLFRLHGVELWNSRKEDSVMLADLVAWTKLYEDSCDAVGKIC